jgi:hypothetical protein
MTHQQHSGTTGATAAQGRRTAAVSSCPTPQWPSGPRLWGCPNRYFNAPTPLLSAMWFPPGERAMSSVVALNFNQVGIAVTLVMGGWMVDKGGGGGPRWGLR